MLFTSHIATGLEEGERLGQAPEHVGVAAATQVQAVQLEGGQHEPKHNLILPHLFFYHMKCSTYVLDPYSMAFWFRIRIHNTDPGFLSASKNQQIDFIRTYLLTSLTANYCM